MLRADRGAGEVQGFGPETGASGGGKRAGKPLATERAVSHAWLSMVLPNQPVTLTPEQIAALNQKLSAMRHDINNHLSLMMAAVEMIRLRPEDAPRRLATLAEQPARISRAMAEFSAEFEKALGITR